MGYIHWPAAFRTNFIISQRLIHFLIYFLAAGRRSEECRAVIFSVWCKYFVYQKLRRCQCWVTASGPGPGHGLHVMGPVIMTHPLVLQTKAIRRFVIMEKAPTRAFSWLKAATAAFTFKTLLRHYAKRALIPRSLNVKLGPRRKGHKGRAVWLA